MSKKKPPPAPPEPDESCAHCRWFREHTEAQDQVRWGFCRRYPPQPAPDTDDDGSATVSWDVPIILLPFECGEFRPRLAS